MDWAFDSLEGSKTKNKILVIGDIMLDQYIIGKAKRLSPEAPAPVLTVDESKYYLGGASNVAANIKNLGGHVFLAGVIGKDGPGEMIQKMLKSKDITLVLGIDSQRPTTVKKRIGTKEQLIVRIDREQCDVIPSGMFHNILKMVTLLSDDLRLVTISDYGKGVVSEKLMAAIIDICKAKKIPVIVDPKGNSFEKYRGADIIKPNFSLVEGLYGREINSLKELEEAVEMIFSKTQCSCCIITWEANGALLFTGPGEWIHFPCEIRSNTSYISGAGDVFIAALSMGISYDLSLSVSCDIANKLASATVGSVGTMVASLKDWERLTASAVGGNEHGA